MSTEPSKDEESPTRELTPEEEKRGARTVFYIVIGFFILLAGVIGLIGSR